MGGVLPCSSCRFGEVELAIIGKRPKVIFLCSTGFGLAIEIVTLKRCTELLESLVKIGRVFIIRQFLNIHFVI